MIWAVLILGFVVCALCATLSYRELSNARERARLINIALAKDPATFTVLQQAARHEPRPYTAPARREPDPDRVRQPPLPEGL